MQKGSMFIDETVSINFPMSHVLEETVNGLNAAFNSGDELTWATLWEVVGLTAKTEHACGRLEYEQMVAIWERYGTGP